MKNAKKTPTGPMEIERTGTKIILPVSMNYQDAIIWLQRKAEEEDREVAIHEVIDAYPLDGAYAFRKALETIYGWVDFKNPGFFEAPPAMIGLQVSVDETVQVPWGRMQIPNVAGFVETGMTVKDGRVIFRISGKTKQKHLPEVQKIASLTRELVEKESVYRGKAFRVEFPDLDDDGFNPITHAPRFIDLSQVRPDELIFPERVERLVENTLFTPLKATDACREAQIPLKRGVLLEGPYGVGKTLTLNTTAKLATENGWTYIYLEDTDKLAEGIAFARQYQPAVVVAEDIDRADEEGARTEKMNQILNTIDGIEAKGTEIIVLLTTNHVEHITEAMLRPGRLDAVIPVRPPDEKAVEALVRLYSRGRLAEGETLGEIGKKLANHIPAVIREVVERSKLAAVGRVAREGGSLLLTEADLIITADGMLEHLALLRKERPDLRSDIEKAAELVADAIRKQPAAVLSAESLALHS